MRRARPGNGALAAIDAGYVLFAGGLVIGMAPWKACQVYLNFDEIAGCDPARFWDPRAYTRLRQIKAAVDPENRIQSNHPIPPGQ